MNESQIFEELLNTPVSDRKSLLERICADNPMLRDRIEKLLAIDDLLGMTDEMLHADSNATGITSDFVETPVDGSHGPTTLASGGMIGPYRLKQILGEGGMGQVWLAEQLSPIKREVAIKLIKSELSGSRILSRFEAERQALALMDHPSIAKIFDASQIADRRPYFVMEFVRGVSITKYCDQVQASIEDRLRLFAQACAAVQHAHGKGIIHRDLKPSNIMVSMQDGKPLVKIIDFGVAKAVHQKLAERTLNTEFGQMVGTLEYMAPEQAELAALEIDVRADIYALVWFCLSC